MEKKRTIGDIELTCTKQDYILVKYNEPVTKHSFHLRSKTGFFLTFTDQLLTRDDVKALWEGDEDKVRCILRVVVKTIRDAAKDLAKSEI